MQAAAAIEMRPTTVAGDAGEWVVAASPEWLERPSRAVRECLALVAAATRSRTCGIVYDHADGPRYLGATAAQPAPERRSAWLAAALGAAGVRLLALTDGSFVAPLHAEGTLVGALAFEPGGDPDRVWLGEVAAGAARALLTAREGSWDEASRSAGYEALVEIGTQIQAAEVDAEAVLELIVERARALCRTDVAWLALVDGDDEWVRVTAVSGATQECFRRMAVRVGTGIGGAAVAKRRTILVRDRDLYDNHWPDSVPRALAAEGVVSVLCAPMLRGSRMVGALYLGSRQPTAFGDAVTTLLGALATQAAIAVENGRLYAALATRNATLERAAEIHRALTDASLDGGGTDAICELLTGLCRREVRLLTGGEPPAAGVSLPILAGAEELGWLHAAGSAPLSTLQHRALEHGATVVALELVKQRAALAVEHRLRGELLEELLRCGSEPTPGVVARAAHAGVDLAVPRRVVAVCADGDAALEYLTRLVRSSVSTLAARRGELLVFAVADDGAAATERAVRELHGRAARAGVACRAGISDAHADLTRALREAEAALALAGRGRAAQAVVSCEALGPMRFLLDAPDTAQMTALVRRVLGPLAEHDRHRPRSALLATLRHYLEVDGRQAAAAAACHIHVSTLKYRMARIGEILPRPFQEPDVRFELRLALAVLDVLERLGESPLDG